MAEGRRRLALPGLDDLFPPDFTATGLEQQIAERLASSISRRRADAARIRAALPAASTAERIEALFEPFIQRAVTVGVGGAALGALPLSLFYEDAARRHQARGLLGRQIELLAVALLLDDPDRGADELTDAVLEILHEVYDLNVLRADLRRRGLAKRLRDEGVRGVAKLALRKVFVVLDAGREAAELYQRYTRFRELKTALRRWIARS